MSDHYYSNNPQSEMITEAKSYTLRGRTFTLMSSTGVFSKKGVDYGSKLLLESFVLPEVQGNILDLGCGYGPIGLSLAADFPEREVYMLDVNERAIMLAMENARHNKIENVTICQSDGFNAVEAESFAAVVTNPPIRAGKQLIFSFFDTSYHQLVNGGELWIVIQKKQGAPSAKKYLEMVFQEVDIITKKKGYYIIQAKKISLD